MGIPKTKLKRAFTGGKTALEIGGNTLKYIAKKPFVSSSKKSEEKNKLHLENAEILFKGLSQLKGTALKIAQLLCLELELLPEEYRTELEKSCYQVPPMNQAIVLKILSNEYQEGFQEIYSTFDTKAFAAASLGQVHLAVLNEKKLAVKLQYPSIKDTIDNDIQLILTFSKALKEYKLIEPALKEIRERLIEETDYRLEAKNQLFFKTNYFDPEVIIPNVYPDLSTNHIIVTDYIEGTPLIEWIKTRQPQEVKNRIAQSLYDFFIYSCYELNMIHADPNPGNFIITPENQLAIIDYGCAKRLDSEFMDHYRKIPSHVLSNNKDGYFETLQKIGLIKNDVSDDVKTIIFETIYKMSDWLCKPYKYDFFDFAENPNFMSDGKAYSQDFFEFSKHIEMNPEFLFLERTRHGLLRLFEKLGAKLNLQNKYENYA
jgi:predicted unusual protein kinase regulating ubiquinone biosynthesis (AarF/ABC1/UbiB family)